MFWGPSMHLNVSRLKAPEKNGPFLQPPKAQLCVEVEDPPFGVWAPKSRNGMLNLPSFRLASLLRQQPGCASDNKNATVRWP